MSEPETDGKDRSLKERIEDEMVVSRYEELLVEEPDRHRLADCLDGIVGITRESLKVVPQDGFGALPNSAQVVAFCLGQWAAHYLDSTKATHPRIARVVAETPLQEGDFERHCLLSVSGNRVGVNPDELDSAISFVNEAKSYAKRRSASKQSGPSTTDTDRSEGGSHVN